MNGMRNSRTRAFVFTALGLAVLIAAGGVFASNMGFKLNKTLPGKTASVASNGVSIISLPYNRQTGIDSADQLFNDVNTASGGAGNVVQIAKFVTSDNAFVGYFGLLAANNYALAIGEGYLVEVNADVNYIVVGSHKPGLSITLSGAANGVNYFSHPYHSTKPTASDLFDEMNTAGPGTVEQIAKFVTTDNAFVGYFGLLAANNFNLDPGDGLLVDVTADITFIPAHY